MAVSERFLGSECFHPIDLVEHVAGQNSWEFDRIAEDQISVVIEGLWRRYSVTLSWARHDKILQLLCCFEMRFPEAREAEVYKVLNLANERCWSGAFSYHSAENLMVYRYGLISDDAWPTSEQIDRMITEAFDNTERFFPAFQLVSWADRKASSAMSIVMAKAYGRA